MTPLRRFIRLEWERLHAVWRHRVPAISWLSNGAVVDRVRPCISPHSGVHQSPRKELSFPLCRSPFGGRGASQRFIGAVRTPYALLCSGPFKLKLLLFTSLSFVTWDTERNAQQHCAAANIHCERTVLNECNTIEEYIRSHKIRACNMVVYLQIRWFSGLSVYSTKVQKGRSAQIIAWVKLMGGTRI